MNDEEKRRDALIRKMLDPVKARKSQQATKRKLMKDVLDSEWMPPPPVKLDIDNSTKRNCKLRTYIEMQCELCHCLYFADTVEENYRAYRTFAIMDVDNGGSVSLREMKRVLMGDVYKEVTVEFDHPDCGITWTTDDEGYVVVKGIDPVSPAIHQPNVIQKLRLAKINGTEVGNARNSLQLLFKLIVELDHNPIRLDFIEPALLLSEFSSVMEVEINGTICKAQLPIGAVYDLDKFERDATDSIHKSHPYLQWITLRVEKRNRQVVVECTKILFRILWGTGPNSHMSCRYALGFGSDDTDLGNIFRGQEMLIDLNLGISVTETDILLDELFQKFDTDGSGEFEFEEFRDFYVKMLDTEESRGFLRRFAQFRFRDLEKEAWWKAKEEERIRRAERRKNLRIKNAATVEEQRRVFLAGSFVGEDHVRRRIRTKVRKRLR